MKLKEQGNIFISKLNSCGVIWIMAMAYRVVVEYGVGLVGLKAKRERRRGFAVEA